MALLIGAFALSACGGGGTTTPAPSTAAVTSPAPTTAATTPPATTEPSVPGTDAPAASIDTSVDPAEGLEIADPYSLDELDAQTSELFLSAFKQSLGQVGDVFQIGVRAATKGGQQAAFVIVVRFPDLPIGGEALLNAAASGSAGSGATIEDRTIAGKSVKVIDAAGGTVFMSVLNDDLIMVVGLSKSQGNDVAKAVFEAN